MRPKARSSRAPQRYQIYVNDTATKADQYRTLIIAYRNGAAVRLSDVADVTDSVEDVRNLGMSNGKPAMLVILFRTPGANIVATVANVKGILPQLQAALPPPIDLSIAIDRTGTIRDSLRDVRALDDGFHPARDVRRLLVPARWRGLRSFPASPCPCRSSARSP